MIDFLILYIIKNFENLYSVKILVIFDVWSDSAFGHSVFGIFRPFVFRPFVIRPFVITFCHSTFCHSTFCLSAFGHSTFCHSTSRLSTLCRWIIFGSRLSLGSHLAWQKSYILLSAPSHQKGSFNSCRTRPESRLWRVFWAVRHHLSEAVEVVKGHLIEVACKS